MTALCVLGLDTSGPFPIAGKRLGDNSVAQAAPLQAVYMPIHGRPHVTVLIPSADHTLPDSQVSGRLLGAMYARGEIHHVRVELDERGLLFCPPGWILSTAVNAGISGIDHELRATELTLADTTVAKSTYRTGADLVGPTSAQHGAEVALPTAGKSKAGASPWRVLRLLSWWVTELPADRSAQA